MILGGLMREIKFRGKRVDNGEWVYGYYVIHDMCIGKHDFRNLILCNNQMSDMFPVIPESVGQFTGLADIYGGDNVILTSQMSTSQYPIGIEGVVRFIECGWYVDTGRELIMVSGFMGIM